MAQGFARADDVGDGEDGRLDFFRTRVIVFIHVIGGMFQIRHEDALPAICFDIFSLRIYRKELMIFE